MAVRGTMDIIDRAKEINSTTDETQRERLCDSLRDTLYDLYNNDEISYYNGTIYETYINWDSCCTCSVIDVRMDAETIIDYMIDHNIEPDLEKAAEIVSLEFSERTEYWGDVFDDDKYVDLDVLDMLLSIENKTSGKTEFVRDYDNRVAERRMKE